MAERDITQTEGAKLIEMKQSRLSKLLRGHFELVSVEKLPQMPTAFDQSVEIALKPYRMRNEAGRITAIVAWYEGRRLHDIQRNRGWCRA